MFGKDQEGEMGMVAEIHREYVAACERAAKAEAALDTRAGAVNSLLVAVAHAIAALKNGGGAGHVIVELEDALHRFGNGR